MEENKNKTHLVIIIILVLISVILAIAVGVLSILYLTKQCDCQCLVEGNKTTEKIIYTIETQTKTVYTSTPPEILKDHECRTLLEKYGRKFYEESFYEKTPKEQLSKYTEIGVKIDLENLIKYINLSTQQNIESEFMINGKIIYDLKETIVYIYPKEPYGIKDYDIKIDAKLLH